MRSADINEGLIEFAARVLWADGQRRLKQGQSDLPRTRTDFRAAAAALFNHPALAALTAPPARTYAEGVSGEALFRAFMASDVTRLTTTALPEEWPHMMPSYRAAWEDLAIRLLSQGEKA